MFFVFFSYCVITPKRKKKKKTIGITLTSTLMTDRSKETFRSSVEFHVLNKQEAQKVRVAQHCKGVVTRAMESPSVRQFFILAKLLNSPQHNPSMHSLKSPFTDPSTKSVCISGGLIHTNCSYEQPGGPVPWVKLGKACFTVGAQKIENSSLLEPMMI